MSSKLMRKANVRVRHGMPQGGRKIVILSGELAEQVVRLAHRDRRSFSSMVRLMLYQWLDEHAAKYAEPG